MKKDKYLIIAFDSTSHALDLEDKAKNKMQGRLIPLPREIEAGCGLCFASLELNQEKWHRFSDEREDLLSGWRMQRKAWRKETFSHP